MPELFPCPFCGTRLDDPDKPASEIHGGGFTFECGGCGANWPRIQREDALSLDDEGIAAFFNRRTAQPARQHLIKARRIIRSLLECEPYDAETQAEEFLKETEEYEDD